MGVTNQLIAGQHHRNKKQCGLFQHFATSYTDKIASSLPTLAYMHRHCEIPHTKYVCSTGSYIPHLSKWLLPPVIYIYKECLHMYHIIDISIDRIIWRFPKMEVPQDASFIMETHPIK